MFLLLANRVRDAVTAHILKRYSMDIPFVIEQPRVSNQGELALPVCFALAKVLKQSPRKIAEQLAADISPITGLTQITVAGAGFLNLHFDRAAYAEGLRTITRRETIVSSEKIIVEHTNINPNKAAHIGHLRNAVLGDTLVRMLRRLGKTVEVQNYIDNTGVQVADVVAGFHFLEKKGPEEVKALIDDPTVRFDYYCWDLYARTAQQYKTEPSSKEWRSTILHAIESDKSELAELARIISNAIVNAHLDTMRRINVNYDVLPRESEILHLKFWASAFELLKKCKVIHLETTGKNSGCWVMRAELFHQKNKKGDKAGNKSDKQDPDEKAFNDSKIIVRSDDTVTYVGKDIAYQLWKFGLIKERDFRYSPFRQYNDHTLWASTDADGSHAAPKFGAGSRVFNVIDVRQSYLQDVVQTALRSLGFVEQANNSIHFSYEMVALSPRCCAELGIELSKEDQQRSYVEISGRKGLGVKADELIDMLIEKAFDEVRSRHSETSDENCRAIAMQIAIGALRYFMLRFTRTTVIAFDLQEALSFEGETGPYVQYAAVRARNILRKFVERGEIMPDFDKELSNDVLARQLANKDFWQVLLEASRCDWNIDRALAAGEPARLARYAFTLAQSFNNFYHQHHILNEPDRERKVFLLWMTQFFVHELTGVLDTMGIAVPEVM